MKKINIAVIVDQPEKIGGGFTHSINLCKDILTKNTNNNLNFKFYCFNKTTFINLEKQKIFSKIIKYSYFNLFKKKLMMYSFKTSFFKIFGISHFEKVIINDKIDLVLFTHPSADSVLLRKTNFIYTIWDMCHSDHPEFPEIKLNREYLSRENIYSLSCGTATAILVESETTKNIISERYNVNRNKIFKINLYYNKFQNISKNPSEKIKNIISTKYFFYPAQFWAHKNHIYILNVLKKCKIKYNKTFNIIFTGADMGNLEYIKDITKEYNLESQVFFLDFVNDTDLYHLYKNSEALVMPTFFGPSNIPPLEAINLDIPVIYSNKEIIKEQFDGATFEIDLENEDSLIDIFLNFKNDDNKIKDKLKMYPKIKNKFSSDKNFHTLENIIIKFIKKRVTWK